MIVVWQVTDECNFSCGFCKYDKRLAIPRRQAQVDEVERFGKLLSEYRLENNRKVLLSFLGGEPLLWPPLFSVAEKLAPLGVTLSLTTNGSALTSLRVRQSILSYFSEITISVDGFAETHEALRGQLNSWSKLKSSVLALNSERIKRNSPLLLRINIVVMKDNIDDFNELCRELASWGIDEICFNQLGGRDRPEFFSDHRLQPQDVMQLRQAVTILRQDLAEIGVRLLGDDRYIDRIAASSNDSPMPIADCRPGEDYLFVDESDRVSPCSFTGAELGVPLAKIKTTNDVQNLVNTYRALRNKQRPSVCADCPSTQVFAKFRA
ncbi:MAG: radical SAM protein [Thalassolituus oleivorans]|uniref:radical SAM protein n=1 Tax=Thalassolituus oleivorans TaxID=187493 RepID=UPI001B6EDB20|nr:radical SAM protein [Thalassolituus oleivorans]MBQ0729033.1 radical SAM protein [Thalassolituus oleivorans]MBQ0779177.1 radical SAM protein [Thalassolituus oleivorans]